jgi:hypothetical protein
MKQKPRTHLILKCYTKRYESIYLNVFDKKDEEEQASSENLLSIMATVRREEEDDGKRGEVERR